jgi:hypothetical protein
MYPPSTQRRRLIAPTLCVLTWQHPPNHQPPSAPQVAPDTHSRPAMRQSLHLSLPAWLTRSLPDSSHSSNNRLALFGRVWHSSDCSMSLTGRELKPRDLTGLGDRTKVIGRGHHPKVSETPILSSWQVRRDSLNHRQGDPQNGRGRTVGRGGQYPPILEREPLTKTPSTQTSRQTP